MKNIDIDIRIHQKKDNMLKNNLFSPTLVGSAHSRRSLVELKRTASLRRTELALDRVDGRAPFKSIVKCAYASGAVNGRWLAQPLTLTSRIILGTANTNDGFWGIGAAPATPVAFSVPLSGISFVAGGLVGLAGGVAAWSMTPGQTSKLVEAGLTSFFYFGALASASVLAIGAGSFLVCQTAFALVGLAVKTAIEMFAGVFGVAILVPTYLIGVHSFGTGYVKQLKSTKSLSDNKLAELHSHKVRDFLLIDHSLQRQELFSSNPVSGNQLIPSFELTSSQIVEELVLSGPVNKDIRAGLVKAASYDHPWRSQHELSAPIFSKIFEQFKFFMDKKNMFSNEIVKDAGLGKKGFKKGDGAMPEGTKTSSPKETSKDTEFGKKGFKKGDGAMPEGTKTSSPKETLKDTELSKQSFKKGDGAMPEGTKNPLDKETEKNLLVSLYNEHRNQDVKKSNDVMLEDKEVSSPSRSTIQPEHNQSHIHAMPENLTRNHALDNFPELMNQIVNDLFSKPWTFNMSFNFIPPENNKFKQFGRENSTMLAPQQGSPSSPRIREIN